MSIILFCVGLFFLSVGLFDFYSAFFETATFNDVANQLTTFQIIWYILGVVYGAICSFAVKSIPLKIFSALVALICIFITAFVIYDTFNDSQTSAQECVSLPTQQTQKCIEALNIKN